MTKLSGRCAACGERFPHGSQVCCLLDPRETFVNGDGKSRRGPGDWCLWCGDDCPEGRSFCKKGCGREYAEDVVIENAGRMKPACA